MKRIKDIKVSIVCLMLLFVCSCHDNSGNSISDDSNKTNRSEEIIKIMRKQLLHNIEIEIEAGGFNWMSVEDKEKLLSEIVKMKEDYYYYYYVMDPNFTITIPGPNWEIKGPLPFDNAPTEGFRKKCEEGDELYYYSSDANSWGALRGCEGYVLIRDNKQIAKMDTAIN